MSESDLLTRLTATMERLMRPAIPVEYDLWDSDTIAAYLKCSAAHVMQRYAPLPNFPQTIRLPTGGSRGTPRWKAADVIAWAEKYQERRKA